MSNRFALPVQAIQAKIYLIRGSKVMLATIWPAFTMWNQEL